MVLKAIADFAGIAASVAESGAAIIAALQRGTVIQVKNGSKTTIALSGSTHESGEFSGAPDNTIPPDMVSIFGVRGFGLPQGRMDYFGQGRNILLTLSWEVQLFAAVIAHSNADGGARDYYTHAASSGLDGVKFDLFDRPLEAGWRRCAKCASLNHQTNGTDAACIVGAGTHDNSLSHAYEVIAGGFTPWRRCNKCECMVMGPGPCHAGGAHDLALDPSYTLVSLAGAPGEAGWNACAKCGGLTIDESRPCPAGGTHTLIPGSSVSVQFR